MKDKIKYRIVPVNHKEFPNAKYHQAFRIGKFEENHRISYELAYHLNGLWHYVKGKEREYCPIEFDNLKNTYDELRKKDDYYSYDKDAIICKEAILFCIIGEYERNC